MRGVLGKSGEVYPETAEPSGISLQVSASNNAGYDTRPVLVPARRAEGLRAASG
jgi:hypothetical protein